MTNQPSLQQQILGDELLTREQVAELLDLSPLSVARMVSRGELPCIRYARRVRFRASDIRAWLNARMTYIYHGPTEEEQTLLERQRTLHEACRCEHVADILTTLLAKVPENPRSVERVSTDLKTTDADELLDTRDIAQLLNLSPTTISRWLPDLWQRK